MKRIFIAFLSIWLSPLFVSADEMDSTFQAPTFTISTWNLGHFSLGAKPYSVVKGESFGTKACDFKKVLADSLGADIFCFNEYSNIFGEDEGGIKRLTKNLFPAGYTHITEGPLLGYSCNALFSRLRFENVEMHLFDCTKPFVERLPRAANYYWLSADLYVQEYKIKLVCAHTISSHGALCSAMIVEIINHYANDERVLLCGDWNSLGYTLFTQAGYTLANSGSFLTYPKKSYPLDNIMVRGLSISDVRLVRSDLSDHYPLVCKIKVN